MKKPPTPKQIIEGKEPNELTDLLEMESPVEKAWEDLKEATENYNKEALKAMGETPTENVNETNQSVVIDEKITTKENWMDAVKEEWGYYNHGCFGSIKGTINFIEHHLLTQRQEILEMAERWFLRLHNEPELWTVDQALTDLSHRIEERYKHNN